MSGPVAHAWVDMRQVTVRYGRVQALDQVTLRITSGERVALVGANGSGKSTLLRVLHGLADASGGGFQCNGNMRQAMLFQRPHMLRTSAQNNVALALWLRGTRWRDARTAALAALQRVGLQDIAAQNARTLSGGQQQRVALARAWALR
ncbi:MAG: ATP-binding cassette domain-containing protein, partial [Acidovorax sp.]|uniref:ATP-binding cassette domain-containing protein n=1 Tax=Acidovorax sp. TaxID=1872122 RepID=UPI00391C2747